MPDNDALVDKVTSERGSPHQGARPTSGVTLLAAALSVQGKALEAQAQALREVLTVLDAGGDFQCGPKGKHRALRERIRRLLKDTPARG